jgi:DNA-binding CsgD family transcriptional regulator/tetratricopeptide (TPR) repeat protein
MHGRLSSSHFIGRQSELAELELGFLEALDGRPALILVGGDSGVGKTRLLAEAQASLPGALVLRGECLEQGDGELPYAPLLGALRPLVRERHSALSELSAGSLAHLGALLPSLGEAQATTGAGLDGNGTGQVRLFEALLELLHLLSARQPLVLILEDMHWADRSTRTFAAFLTRSLRSERILLLLTYRSDELHRRHPLRPLLAELDRIERTRRIDLEPFDRAEIAEALGDILGRPADDELVDRLLARSEGNPLYIEELLAAALDGRGAAPQSLRDAFMLRIERLSPDARSAAQAVAVGRRLDQGTIATVSGIPRDQLRAGLRETVTEHVLVPADDGRFHFRHALLREVLYDDLLPGERGELHMELAHALEQAEPAACEEDEIERVAAIATHYAAAGDQTAALRATVRAAREAQRVHAYGEVADLAERAMELWPRVPEPEATAGVDHVDLLELAAAGHGMAGDRARSATLREHALSELDLEQEPLRYGRALAELAKLYWTLNRGPEGLEAAQRALAMVPADQGVDRAALLSWLARTRVLRGHYREAIGEGELALSAARAGGYETIVGEVLDTLGMARIALGDVQAGEEQLREAIELYRERRDGEGFCSAYSNLADFLSLTGRTADALQVIREGLQECPVQMGRSHGWMEVTRVVLAFEAGDWELARSAPRPSTASLVGVSLIFALLVDAEIALGLGDDQLAAASLEAAAPLVRVSSEAQWHGGYGALLAELQRRYGDLEKARGTVARALDELEVCTDDVMRIARVTAVGLGVEADRVLRARDLKDGPQTKDALERVRIHLERLEAAAQDGGPVERAWHLVGAAEAARAKAHNSASMWSSAAAAWDELGRPYPAASARWRQAEALLEAGDREAAATVAADSAHVARRLGAAWLLREVETLMARGRLITPTTTGDAQGEAGPDGVSAGAEELPFGLTPRELQVLTLLSAGATNRQIGADLYMAEKTASVHVSRILAKLDVKTRTQAAAVAHRLRLGESPAQAAAGGEPGSG